MSKGKCDWKSPQLPKYSHMSHQWKWFFSTNFGMRGKRNPSAMMMRKKVEELRLCQCVFVFTVCAECLSVCASKRPDNKHVSLKLYIYTFTNTSVQLVSQNNMPYYSTACNTKHNSYVT